MNNCWYSIGFAFLAMPSTYLGMVLENPWIALGLPFVFLFIAIVIMEKQK
jgi:hypothetical protein